MEKEGKKGLAIFWLTQRVARLQLQRLQGLGLSPPCASSTAKSGTSSGHCGKKYATATTSRQLNPVVTNPSIAVIITLHELSCRGWHLFCTVAEGGTYSVLARPLD
mmetsp:Transcript_59922/g.115593  ORF Transcript_59922/g.115593 Transcript_59922/m.115593 type:complete len:106 (+) Transcript_59922:127-444(+)